MNQAKRGLSLLLALMLPVSLFTGLGISASAEGAAFTLGDVELSLSQLKAYPTTAEWSYTTKNGTTTAASPHQKGREDAGHADIPHHRVPGGLQIHGAISQALPQPAQPHTVAPHQKGNEEDEEGGGGQQSKARPVARRFGGPFSFHGVPHLLFILR